MARSEGSWGSSTHHWYGYMKYTTSAPDGATYRIDIPEIGFTSSSWGFDIGSVTVKYGATDWSDWYYGSKAVKTSTGSTTDVPIVTNTWFTWTRTHSSQTKLVQYYVTNTSGYDDGESYGKFEVTVPAKPSYTISYNANGGSGAPSSHKKWYNESTTLWGSAYNPTRTGYTFDGWNTKANGSGTSYAAGATITAGTNQALTLYAQWSIVTYTVKYNANASNVTGVPSNQTKQYGKTLTLSSTTPKRTGYNFLGWATSSSGAVAYKPGGSYTKNAALNLYAKWEATYTAPTISNLKVIRCDSNGDAADEGTSCLVSFNWKLNNGGGNPVTASATVGTQTYSEATSSSSTATSGSYSYIFSPSGGFDVNTQFNVKVTVTDSGGSATKTTTLSPAFFTIDVRSGGHGIAFGAPASYDGLIFGMPIKNTAGKEIANPNSSGSLVFGYGLYSASAGDLYLYGNNVRLLAKNSILADGNAVVTSKTVATGSGVGLYGSVKGSDGLYHRFMLTDIPNLRHDTSTDGSTWTTAEYFVKEYQKGDSFTQNMSTAGYVTSSSKNIVFFVPLDRPVSSTVSGVTCTTKGTLVLRGINGYCHGSSASAGVTPSSVTCNWRNNGIDVTCVMSAITNASNNTPVGITVSNMVLKFT